MMNKILCSAGLLLIFLLIGCTPTEKDLASLPESELLKIYESLCSDQAEFAKDSCLTSLLRFTGDPKFCEKDFFISGAKQHCLNLYQEYLAGKWPTKFESTHVQLFETQNLTLAKCMELEQSSRDSCFTNVAAGTQDSTVCSKIVSEEEQEYCKSIVAEQLGDSGVCATLSTYKNRCYSNTALITENKAICKNIVDNQFTEVTCYLEILNKIS